MVLKHIFITLLFCTTMYLESTPKKAIIIGATSEMAQEVARQLSKEGYVLGLVGHDMAMLQAVQAELSGPSYVQEIDVTLPEARAELTQLIERMQGLDVMIISIGHYTHKKNEAMHKSPAEQAWIYKEQTLDGVAKSFMAMADVALEHFKRHNYGHLMGISSTAELRRTKVSPAYGGAQACVCYYLEEERREIQESNFNICISNAIFDHEAIERSIAEDDPLADCQITTEQASAVIVESIKAHQELSYFQQGVSLIVSAIKLLLDWLYSKYCA